MPCPPASTTTLGRPGASSRSLTGAADTANSKADLKEGLGFFNTFLLAFAYIALFVGMFIIYNTFSIVVAQRARDMAMLRAIGASRAQVVRSVVFESVAVGVVASAIGLGVGVLMSFGLRALLSAVGLEVPSGPIVIAPSTVITAFLVGTAITVVSALWPAVRSSRVKPIAALRDVAIDVSGSSVVRTGAGLAILGLGVASFAVGIFGGGSALALIGFGTVATIIGVFVLGPVLAIPLMHVLGAPVAGHLRHHRAPGPGERQAQPQAHLGHRLGPHDRRGPGRLHHHPGLLDQGGDLGHAVASRCRPTTSSPPGRSATAVSARRSRPTCRPCPRWPRSRRCGRARSRWTARSSQVAAVDIRTIDQVADLGVTAGRLADVTGASVAVEDRKAEDDGLAVGDTITMTFARTGAVELTVRALIDRPPPGGDGMVYMIGLDTYEANVTDQFDRQVFVKVADGVSPAQATAALDTVLAEWPNGELQDQAAFEESVASQIDIILNLIYGLLGLAIVIALIGIANTLALSVHERRRELGLLRAVGMTRPQVRSAIRWESVMIALMGTFLGFALAVAGSWGIISAIEGDRPIPLVVPPVQLTVIVVLASVAGVLAAVGPARRAAKLDILAAIASH